MTNDIDKEKSQESWTQDGQNPLNLIMRNPVLTSPILLILAVAPIVITALILVLVLTWQ